MSTDSMFDPPEPAVPLQQVGLAEGLAPWPFVDRRVARRRFEDFTEVRDSDSGTALGGPSLTDAHDMRRLVTARKGSWQRNYVKSVVAADAVMVALAALAAYGLRFVTLGYPQTRYLMGALILPGLWVTAMAMFGGYTARLLDHAGEELKYVVQAAGASTLVVMTLSYTTKQQVARGYLLAALPFAAVASTSGRQLCRRVVVALRRHGLCRHRALIVGHERSVNHVVQQVRRDGLGGLEVVGACVPRGASALLNRSQVPVLGGLDDVLATAMREAVDVVAVTTCVEVSEGALRRLAWALEGSDVELMVAPALVDVASPRLHITSLCGLPMLHLAQPTFRGPRVVFKEVLDRFVATALLVVLSPLILAIIAAIRIDSPGAAFFRQVRVGRGGGLFTLYKYRSMYADAEDRLTDLQAKNECADGLLFKMRDDPRITRVGRWLRRTSLDELPQLINVMRGQMSLVGPRPPLPSEVERYGRDVTRRLLVKPGMTGLWQVSGRSNLTWEESMRLDLRYVENWSLTLDAAILWRTLFSVLRGAGAY